MDSVEERSGDSPEPSRESADEYRQVRELLLGGEQRQLTLLHHRLQEVQHLQQKLDERCEALHANEVDLARRITTIVQRGDEFVERNLSAAIQRRAAGNDQSRAELVHALKGPVEESLRQSISEDPNRLGAALGPVVGPEVNRNLWEAFGESGLQKVVRFRADGTPKLAWPAAIMISLLLIALTGWLVVAIKGNLGLEQAAEALGKEPGIVIASVENPVLGKPRIAGLRDPLAPAAEEILSSAGLQPEAFTLDLQPFQSVDTPYAHQREQDRVRDLEDLKRALVTAIGEFKAANETARKGDLETFTRALFALQFPEAAGKVALAYRDERWILRGAVEEPLYSKLLDRSPKLVLTGEVDTSGVKNATSMKLTKLGAEIAKLRLDYVAGTVDLSESGIRQADQLIKLIRERELEAEKAGRLPASFTVHALPVAGTAESSKALLAQRIEIAEKLLMELAEIPVERILPGVIDTGAPPGEDGVYVKVTDPETN